MFIGGGLFWLVIWLGLTIMIKDVDTDKIWDSEFFMDNHRWRNDD